MSKYEVNQFRNNKVTGNVKILHDEDGVRRPSDDNSLAFFGNSRANKMPDPDKQSQK